MNRLAPCDACGCPILFHTPRPAPGGGPALMVCAECSRATGRERVCPEATAA